MDRLILIALIVIAASPAAAACTSLPDNQDSAYVENRTALALCQQRELGQTTNDFAVDAKINAQLGNMQMQIDRQRALQQQQISNGWPLL